MAFGLSSLFGSNTFTNFVDNGINSLVGDNGVFTNYEGAWDKFKNGDTNEVNKEIANENLKYQRENLDYQKALQQKIFDREDSAYARTVADMRSAGLSPLAMQSTNGAGEAIQTNPLHNDYQHQGAGFGDIVNYAFQLNDAVQNSKYNNASISNLQSQTDYTNAQTEAQNTTNEFLPANLAVNLVGQLLNNKNIAQSTRNLVAQRSLTMLQTLEQSYKNSMLKNDLEDSNRWEAFASQFGVSKDMSEKERYIKYAKQLLQDEYDSETGEYKPKFFQKPLDALANSDKPEPIFKLSPEMDEAVENYFHNLAERGQRNFEKHGFRIWKWFGDD